MKLLSNRQRKCQVPCPLGALQGSFELLGVPPHGQAERADVLLDGAGSGGRHTDAAAVEPLLAAVAADHGRVGVVGLLAHAVQVLAVLLVICRLCNAELILWHRLAGLLLQEHGNTSSD